MERMKKQIRVLLLLTVFGLGGCSCLSLSTWSLMLNQNCFYYLVGMLLLASIGAGLNYYRGQRNQHYSVFKEDRQQFLYTLLLLVNVLGLALIIIEYLLTGRATGEEFVEVFLPSFFFLFGIDLLVFLPIQKYVYGLKNILGKKQLCFISGLAILIVLRNPWSILSMTFYIALGMLFLGLLVPKVIRWEVSFYSHLMRDILLVVFLLFLF